MFKNFLKNLCKIFPFGLGLLSCATVSQKAPTKTIFAIGDLHGDLKAAKRAFALTGATDTQGNWISHNHIVVQTGDLIDRGPEDIQVLDWLSDLQKQARTLNSELYLLNGNHEMMNARGDFRYIHPENFKSMAAKTRKKAFLPGGRYAKQLAERPVILQLNETVFVHGGVLPEHIDYGIEKTNQAYRNFLSNGTALPAFLQDSDQSPLWTRIYSNPSHAAACDTLKQTLSRLGVKRMVVAHSVQPNINSACNKQVWRIDTGMSMAYGGTVQVLKIEPHQVTVLRD